MSLRKTISWAALLGTSFGLHAVGFANLNRMGTTVQASASKKPTFMEMTSTPKPVAPSPDPPQVTERPAPRATRRVAATAARPPATSQAAARAVAPQQAAETPADFSGATLTNDGSGAGWASATGNGMAMNHPIGRPGARITGRQIEGTGQVIQPALTAVADLSRLPEAPRLEDALERNYPREARQSGQAGKAVVRARISAEGRVHDLTVISETAAGFGRACHDTLTGSRWSPPIDRSGHAVATIINYTCRFEVR